MGLDPKSRNPGRNDITDTILGPVTCAPEAVGLMPLAWCARRRRGAWKPERQSSGLVLRCRNLWRQGVHLFPAKQRYNVVLRQMLPVRLAKRDPLLPGEPDPPRRLGVKRESIPGRLAAEASLRRPLFNVVLQKDRRRIFFKAVPEMALDQLQGSPFRTS